LIQTRLGASREHTVVSVRETWSIYASGIGGKCLVCRDVESPTKITSRIALRLQKPHDTSQTTKLTSRSTERPHVGRGTAIYYEEKLQLSNTRNEGAGRCEKALSDISTSLSLRLSNNCYP
jgi:hypothetical protein